ncbi:MAG: gamma-glutamyltransferase [Mariprofundus sp.]|nr:gamma-glutamyltransferase [Mariprofundus sp.]
MRVPCLLFGLLAAALAAATTAVATAAVTVSTAPTLTSSMVVSAQADASKAGIAILKAGGNAFDAAAATTLALGVVEPGSSGLGGGGFFLLYIAKEKRYVMLDARETSPKLAGDGTLYQTRSSIDGPQAAGVPGIAAGVDHLIQRYGRLKRAQITQPAITLAQHGFQVSDRLKGMLQWRAKAFNDTGRRIFLHKRLIKQAALADTLKRFAKKGAADFYQGETAGRLVADMKRDGGLIRADDLAAYRVIEREPVRFDYQDFEIISAALPSSGGLTLAHIFGQLRDDDLRLLDETERAHLLIESMKRAYRDRNQYLGDADFVSVPDNYLDATRLQRLRSSIHLKATALTALQGLAEPAGNGTDTTHFSIIDAEGNMVSATLSINYAFGSAYVSPSTGILLNDEMDDFATRPGQPNAYGLVQGTANAVAPGKRMLSSMTPTFVIGPKRSFIVGTPGGSRIISMVLLSSLAFMLDEKPPADWLNRGRYHHQFLPDVVQYESGAFTAATQQALKQRGHHFKQISRRYGNMQAILWQRESGTLTGIVDQRGEGSAMLLKQ